MPAWLTARPVAHRGLHDHSAGVIENTPSAFRAAIAENYAIECDLRISADGEAMVYHDDALGRLTQGTGKLAELTAAALKRTPFFATSDRMLTLGELCELVQGRVGVFVELKSQFDGDLSLAGRVAKVLSTYRGPIAAMSFDPEPIAALKGLLPALPRGLVAQRSAARDPESGPPSPARYARHALTARLQFLAYRVDDLPAAFPLFARKILGLPVLAWTVRSQEDRRRAAQWADQIIFENFRP